MDFSSDIWSGVVPVPQDDGPDPLVPIAYSADYAKAMNYFRAVSVAGERSERVLELTSYIINENPSHYAVWKYRLDTVRALGKPMEDELRFTEELASEHPKSYQIWHHRLAVSDSIAQPQAEIEFINRMLQIDSKNYHAWSYRQQIVSKYKLWESDLADIDRLLKEDVRNNSAWNQRFFVFSRRPDEFTKEDLEHEVSYALTRINMAPRNESPWNYLRGVIQQLGNRKLSDFPTAETTALRLAGEQDAVPHALSFLADMYQERKEVEEFTNACKKLVQIDPIRKQYWEYRSSQVKAA